jgi:hypothetical protein
MYDDVPGFYELALDYYSCAEFVVPLMNQYNYMLCYVVYWAYLQYNNSCVEYILLVAPY